MKRARGYTMVELLVVVGIFAAVLGIVAANARSAREDTLSGRTFQQLGVLTEVVRDNWSMRENYNGVNAISVSALAPQALQNGTQLRNPFGGTWVPAAIAWDGQTDGAFSLTLNRVPRRACTALIVQGAPIVHSVQVSGVELKTVVDLGRPVAPATAAAACTSLTANTIVWRTL